MDDDLTIKTAVKDIIPTLFGYIGVGIAYGVVAQTAHLSILTISLLCLIVYAGSAQFAITSMMLTASPISAIILSTFLINSRMILMSTSMAQYFKRDSLLKNIEIGTLLTDETFALGMNKASVTKGKLTPAWFNTANVIAYLVWWLACVLGALAGKLVADPKAFGLDFAVIAMFIGLLYLQMIGDRRRKLRVQLEVVLIVTVSLFVLGRFLNPEIALLSATLIGCLGGMAVENGH
ncbi:azaleucine resistance protein AzlC [Paucilactobacillus hokkaidonensis JCM 18461]|uniref:Azaleucine resistance protein AzlC n=2 Tax=Paucilactobacillus hokkaidonensis TaxID=1193095 RepID=A0A0A1GX55_9LACO|nr:AzlC family ABC transporter permease [Paucilactobacillus hokkaidonensis]KRO11397.1 amino acid transport protein [Paucilactobacillus hokkaidonensis]BAP85051.1 azaleucine resistance protein AzlC [Paucilactobacillus hokkaidonensis JCM 18461]